MLKKYLLRLNRKRWFFPVVLACLVVGCSESKSLQPVTGIVTVQGKPASGAVIMFHPENPEQTTVTGVVDTEGRFSLVSGMDAGIAAGKYIVTVTWPDPSKEPTQAQIMMGTDEPGPDLLKGKYSSKAKTSLTAEIDNTTTTLPAFTL